MPIFSLADGHKGTFKRRATLRKYCARCPEKNTTQIECYGAYYCCTFLLAFLVGLTSVQPRNKLFNIRYTYEYQQHLERTDLSFCCVLLVCVCTGCHSAVVLVYTPKN